MLSVADYARVRRSLLSGAPIALRSSSYTSAHRDHIDRVLSLYLYELGLVHIHSNLAYCVHELAGNARNALMKRLWFARRGLDITDRGTYSARVMEFRRSVTERTAEHLQLLEASDYSIRFIFSHDEKSVQIAVEHNAPLLPVERERIAEKLFVARSFVSMADAYTSLTDFSEGAGLGLAMVLVMLRTIGLGPDALSIGPAGPGGTRTRSRITLNRVDLGRRHAPEVLTR